MTVLEKPENQNRAKAVAKSAAQEGDPLGAARFTTAQIAAAADVPAETIRTWYKREILTLEDEQFGRAAEGVGLPRMFSGYTAMTVAIMGKLTAGGMNAQLAYRAALSFVSFGDEARDPCHLFPEGATLLQILKDAKPATEWCSFRVVNLSHDAGGKEWWKLFPSIDGRTVHQIEILWLDELWCAVFQRLGIRSEIERRAEGHAKGE